MKTYVKPEFLIESLLAETAVAYDDPMGYGDEDREEVEVSAPDAWQGVDA